MSGPFKCPDCGTWWTGLEHRCPPSITTTEPYPLTLSEPNVWTTRCTCNDVVLPGGRSSWCPIHDVRVMYSQWVRS